MERPTCKTCPFWQIVYENERKDLEAEGHNVPGECRRNAPKEMRGGGGFASSRYWCGEHPDFPAWIESQRKPEPQGDEWQAQQVKALSDAGFSNFDIQRWQAAEVALNAVINPQPKPEE